MSYARFSIKNVHNFHIKSCHVFTCRYSEAIGLLRNLLSRSLCPGRRGYWTTRLSIDLEHVGCKEESLEVAESALNDSRICNGDRIALQRRVIRLAKPPRRWKKPSFANSLSRSCKEVVELQKSFDSGKIQKVFK